MALTDPQRFEAAGSGKQRGSATMATPITLTSQRTNLRVVLLATAATMIFGMVAGLGVWRLGGSTHQATTLQQSQPAIADQRSIQTEAATVVAARAVFGASARPQDVTAATGASSVLYIVDSADQAEAIRRLSNSVNEVGH